MANYVYIRTEPGLWTVGFYDPKGNWQPESDHDSTEKAAARCHYLNGAAAQALLEREAAAWRKVVEALGLGTAADEVRVWALVDTLRRELEAQP